MLLKPLSQKESWSVVVVLWQRLLRNWLPNFPPRKGGANSGYNALSDEFVTNMFEAGIMDPVKVTRAALENAASAVAILLTTEVAIADEPEKEKPSTPHGHGGMDY